MNPSRYRLPQYVSPDGQRARAATIALEQESYQFASDGSAGNPGPGFQLPPGLAGLPKSEKFGPEKTLRLAMHKLFVQAQKPFVRIAMSGSPMDTQVDYEQVLGWLPRPRAADAWITDRDFAQQRLTGVNPKAIRRTEESPANCLGKASEGILKSRYKTTLIDAMDSGRLFHTDYSVLQNELVQAQVRTGATLAAPTCTFYIDDKHQLMPLAIMLRPEEEQDHPVMTPDSGPGNWLMARSHAQCADAHVHEAVYHLLETHMVSEIFAVCTARQLHPNHPIRQLISPHFKWNLAINYLARGDLLGIGGAIDTVLASGVGGAMDAARLVWRDWSFKDHGFEKDLEKRGLDGKDEKYYLKDYYYRDDAREIFSAFEGYVRRIVDVWYPDDKIEGSGDIKVYDDYELRAWVKEISIHIPNGFPKSISTREELISILTEVIFRATAGHSAVNNGQFDAFAFAPNVSGSIAAGLPGVNNFNQSDVMDALPGTERCVAAIGMAWTLSQPTHRSILSTGESPAFAPDLNPKAYAAVDSLRSRLQRISSSIAARNLTLEAPYTYLDPTNVSQSTEI